MFWVAEDGNFNCHLFSGSHLSIHGSVFTSSGLEKCHVFKHLPTTVWRFKHTLVLHVISIFAPMQSVRKLRLTWNVNLFQISSSRRQKKRKGYSVTLLNEYPDVLESAWNNAYQAYPNSPSPLRLSLSPSQTRLHLSNILEIWIGGNCLCMFCTYNMYI